jgi:beta-phosphoglucomutase-like phosphatase (HAD superfamily)
MGAAPTRSLVVEDSATGIAAAVAAGMTAWAFVGGSHYGAGRDLDPLRRAGATRVFASMNEFGLE